ncbi:MAG: hypothetical protein ACFB21_13550 [Opitutales bacterium]
MKAAVLTLLNNDLKHFRFWLIVWAALVSLPAVLLGLLRSPLGGDPDFWAACGILFAISSISMVLLTFLLVLKVVQKENLRSPRAYWLPLPLMPAQVLVAKALLVALLVAFQALIAVCAHLVLALEVVEVQFWALLLASLRIVFTPMLPAVFTRTVVGAILAPLVIFIPLAVLQNLVFERGGGAPWLMLDLPAGFPLTGVLIGLTLCLAVAIVVWRFLRPRQFRPALAALSLLVVIPWLGTVLGVPQALPKATVPLPEGATLEISDFLYLTHETRGSGIRSINRETMGDWTDTDSARLSLKGKLSWPGLPPNLVPIPQAIATTLSGGKRLPVATDPESRRRLGLEGDVLEGIFPGYESAERQINWTKEFALFEPAPPEALQGDDRPLTLTTTVAVSLATPVAHLTPLEIGKRLELPSGFGIVSRVEQATTDEARVEVMLADTGKNPGNLLNHGISHWVLLDRANRKVYSMDPLRRGQSLNSPAVGFNRVLGDFRGVDLSVSNDWALAYVEFQSRGIAWAEATYTIPQSTD